MAIIDGNGLVFGRMASKVAKMLLNGENVEIINAEGIIISGNPNIIIEKYKHRKSLRNKQNPEKSPKWPKVPHMFVKRLIRGMLPRKKAKGRDALKRLKVYIGNPKGLSPDTEIEEAKPNRAKLLKYISIAELCKHLGWNG